MNYYEARQRKDGVWHWTVMNDNVLRPSQPCTEDCQHQTREEAERHFYEYEVANLRTQEFEAWHKCEAEGCETLTNKVMTPRHGGGVDLCDVHRTAEQYRVLRPFKAGVQIISSW